MKNILFFLFLSLWSYSFANSSKDIEKPSLLEKASEDEDSLKPEETLTEQEPQLDRKLSREETLTVSETIEKVFKQFVALVEKDLVPEEEYKKAVSFLEKSLYDEVSFDSLISLAKVYEEKKDTANQMNVLQILNAKYPNKPESFHLLARAYKTLSKQEKDSDKKKEHRKQAISYYDKALKADPKYLPAYEELLSLFMVKDPEKFDIKHTRTSLNIVLDMLKNLKQNKYYIPLCKAYYDNRFFKRSEKACLLAMKKNPKDPVSPVIYSFGLEDQVKKEKRLIQVAERFPNSFFVQSQVGLYFKDKSPRSAILYLMSAQKLKPEDLLFNKLLAKYLLDNKKEESSYSYFLKACLLSEGRELGSFKKARNFLKRKTKLKLALKFEKGIKECFEATRVNKRKEKKA